MQRSQLLELIMVVLITMILIILGQVAPDGLQTIPIMLEGILLVFLYDKNAKTIDKLNSERSNYIIKMKYEEFILMLDRMIWNTVIVSICEDVIIYTNDKIESTYTKIYANSLTRLLNTMTDDLPYIQKIYGQKFLENYFDTYMTIKIKDNSVLALINTYGTKQ